MYADNPKDFFFHFLIRAHLGQYSGYDVVFSEGDSVSPAVSAAVYTYNCSFVEIVPGMNLSSTNSQHRSSAHPEASDRFSLLPGLPRNRRRIHYRHGRFRSSHRGCGLG
jgi:hypothetical protein